MMVDKGNAPSNPLWDLDNMLSEISRNEGGNYSMDGDESNRWGGIEDLEEPLQCEFETNSMPPNIDFQEAKEYSVPEPSSTVPTCLMEEDPPSPSVDAPHQCLQSQASPHSPHGLTPLPSQSNEDTVDTQPLDDAPATLVALSAATLAQEGGCSLPQVSLTSGQTQLIMNTSHPVQPRVGGMVDVPTLSDMQGKYGFTVSVDDKERSTKSPMWMMSTIVNKLYTNLNKAVPFEVRLKNSPSDEKLFIRAVLVFSSPEFLRTNVNRCPNHTSNTEATNHDFPYPHHVVRADHPGALYQENPSGRLSVVVPLDLQQTGSDYSLILLRFMCLGSCVGGISRRPITIVLTLENGQADVLGRKVIDVRVCACPTRDIRTDEQSVSNRGVKRKGSSTQSHPVMKKIPRLVEPKLDLDESFQEVFNIKVHGRQLYTFLCSMKREYYNSHPDYALRYPDPSITGNSSIRQKNTSNVKEKMNRADIYEENSNVGKSAGSSPVHDGNLVIDAQDSPPHGSTASHLQPPPDCLASTMSLVLMNRDTNGMDSINAHHLAMKAASVPQHLNVTTSIPVFSSQTLSNTKMVPVIPSLASFRSQLTTTQSDSAAFPNGRLPGHVPVMQVRREAPLRRMHSEPKVSGGRQPLAYRKNHNVINMRPMATAGVVLGLDTAGREGDNSSHDSEEILAANVLAQGFAKKSRK